MLHQAQIKYIQSLADKSSRRASGCYIIEGEKIIAEYLQAQYPLREIFAVDDWIEKNRSLLPNENFPVQIVTEHELNKISLLTTPNKVLALAEIPKDQKLPDLKTGLHLYLENLQDPGNFGTIIRTADWFAVDSIFCSENCVDAYNPKVVQAAMGSLARIKIFYTPVGVFEKAEVPVFAAALDGENIFEKKLPRAAILIIGNESKGISAEVAAHADTKLKIPKFGNAESLNAAVAAGIALALFRKG